MTVSYYEPILQSTPKNADSVTNEECESNLELCKNPEASSKISVNSANESKESVYESNSSNTLIEKRKSIPDISNELFSNNRTLQDVTMTLDQLKLKIEHLISVFDSFDLD